MADPDAAVEGTAEPTDPAIESEDSKTEHNSEAFSVREDNVVCALFVTLVGPVLDALCALPGTLFDDLPASLRTSSLVLVVLLGSPSVRADSQYVLEQRGVVAILLAACAFAGMNAAEPAGRNADAVFALVGTLATILAVATNGVMLQQDAEQTQRRMAREQLSALTGALLFYLGMRTFRHALALPSEVVNFRVDHQDISTRGYGVASDMVILGNAFAGAVTVSFACILLLNHELVLRVGSTACSVVAGVLACFVFAGALFAQLAAYCLMERLPALFGDAACDGDVDECAAAYRARRLFSSSNSTSVAWVCAIAMATFAFSHSKRFRTRRQHFDYEPPLWTVESLAVVCAALLSVGCVLVFVDPLQTMRWADVELVCIILSVPVALFNWPVAACCLHAAGQTVYIAVRVYSDAGYSMLYFTHHSMIATLILTVLVGISTAFCYFLYTCVGRRLVSEPVEVANAIMLTALVSIQFFLTLGTLGMASGYTGIHYDSGGLGWRTTGYQFSVQHTVSFFFCAALYASRYEHNMLSTAWRRAAWMALPPIIGLTWVVCVAASGSESGSSMYTAFVNPTSFVVGVSSAVVSWVGVGTFLHV